MKFIYLAGAVALASTLPAFAEDATRDVDALPCKEATDAMVSRTGAEFDRYSPSGGYVFFRHPLTKEFSLDCHTDPKRLNAFLSAKAGAFPPASFYELVGKAGAVVTGHDQKKIRASALQCRYMALKDKDEQGELHLPGGLEVDCQDFTRDGGGTSFTIVSENKW